jgi:hypothetical protein
MSTILPASRTSGREVLGNHEHRLRALERRPPGTWVYVGTYPADQDTTPDSEPFQNGIVNQGGGKQRLRYRRTNENQTEFAGMIAIPDGLDVAGTIVVTLTDPIYQNGEDITGPGIVNAKPCEWLYTATGDLVFNGYTCCGDGGDVPNIIWNEVPFGDIDGINDTFNLNFAVVPSTNMMVFKNGLLMQGGGPDYTLVTSATFVFVPAQIPSIGDVLVVTYQAGTV